MLPGYANQYDLKIIVDPKIGPTYPGDPDLPPIKPGKITGDKTLMWVGIGSGIAVILLISVTCFCCRKKKTRQSYVYKTYSCNDYDRGSVEQLDNDREQFVN